MSPLRVENQDRNPGGERFLDRHYGKAGLAGPGHPDDHAVGGEIRRLVAKRAAPLAILGHDITEAKAAGFAIHLSSWPSRV